MTARGLPAPNVVIAEKPTEAGLLEALKQVARPA